MLYSIPNIDAAILCGGMGTRLRAEIGESQKVMAQVGRQPFLDILLKHLIKQGFKRFILMTGYKAEALEDYYRAQDFGVTIEFSKEEEPLGTGGALKNARPFIESDPFFCINGDSFCALNYKKFLDFYAQQKALGVLVLSSLKDREDFGTIVMDDSQRIVSFQEKIKSPSFGPLFVNAGIYCFSKKVFSLMPDKSRFSLETDFFPSLIQHKLCGFVTKKKFLDIGTPTRFKEARNILPEKIA